MSLKIVNEYITEVLQFDDYLKRALLNSEPIEEPNPGVEVKPEPDPDSDTNTDTEAEINKALEKLSTGGNPNLEILLNQTRESFSSYRD